MSSETRPDSVIAARAEAAAWMARLRGPQRTQEVERGFRRWLHASREHEQAFEALSERLEVVERLRTKTLPRHWCQPTAVQRPRWTQAVAAAALIAAVMLGALFYPHLRAISTEVGEQRTLVLEDGSRIYLNTSSKVRVDYDERHRRIELSRGEALFEVAKDKKRPFVVVAGDRQVKALGTTFVVRQDANALAITLVEGQVEVASVLAENAERETPTLLTPGQRITLKSDAPPVLDVPAIEKVTAWRQGQVAFDDVTLAEAIHEMNRYSSVKLMVKEPKAGAVRVGGYFRMGDSASFARAVAQNYGFQVIEREGQILISTQDAG